MIDTKEAAESQRGTVLLSLARLALLEAFGETPSPPPEAAWLDVPGATFVTLKIDGELRGCIGTLEAYRPLGEDIRGNALAAAFRDPRFPRLEAAELARVRLHVSLLSALEPLACSGEADLLGRLRPGVDGLVLEHEDHRGTFLPAVWRQLPGPRQFLRQLKRKAGLPPEFWAPGVRVSRYTVDSWAEATA